MLLFLLLLPVCSGQVIYFYGVVATYHTKETNSPAVTLVVHLKLNYDNCTALDTFLCSNCGGFELGKVDDESSGEWCQRELVQTVSLNDAPFDFVLNYGNWTTNTVNGVIQSKAVAWIELRNRSDTGRANSSPQTTMVPVVRVPSNCQRDFNLLAFDPDGDEVQCRYGNTSLSECDPCSPPSVLSISSSCSLSFTPTNTSSEGPYVVQLMMEDFPRQNITLTQSNGSTEIRTPNSAISRVPVQFVVDVDPAVPSCTEGLYLPRFLPPTPANGAHLFVPVNQTLEISIKAEANISTISELLLSAPYNVSETGSGAGQFTLSWTPSEKEDGQSVPICFVVQAVHNSTKYHSELRCVVVSVGIDQGLFCNVCNGSSCSRRFCSSNETMCMAATYSVVVDGATPENTSFSGCDPGYCPSTGSHTMSVNLGNRSALARIDCCNTSDCNRVHPPAPAPQASNGRSCSTCDRSSPSCNTSVQCSGVEDRCLEATVNNVTGTVGAYGCASSNLCGAAARLNEIPFIGEPSELNNSPNCVDPPNTTTTPPTTRPLDTTPETTPGPDQTVLRLTVKASSVHPLSEDDIQTSIISELRDELIRRGLTSNFTLISQGKVKPSATPPPAGLK